MRPLHRSLERFRCAFRRQGVGSGQINQPPCSRPKSVQKLNLVTSLRRPKHLNFGLMYFFMFDSPFRFRLDLLQQVKNVFSI
jgi:hypothetical protein